MIAGLVLITILLAPYAHAADNNTKCFDNICVARKPRIWTPELGEVDTDKYSAEELKKMLNDYWTEERMRNATPYSVTVDSSRLSFFSEEDKEADPEYNATTEDYWTPERVQEAYEVQIRLPDGSVRRALVANIGGQVVLTGSASIFPMNIID